MERPMMNPLFMDGAVPPPPRKSLLRRLWGVFRGVARLLLWDICFWRRSRLDVEDAPIWQLLLRSIAYPLLFVPVLVCLLVGGLVYQGTHPSAPAALADPGSSGSHFEPVSFISKDGTPLAGWLVPLIDAKSVLEKKEEALRKKQPAVVLVHDHAAAREQMLPLVRPLHEQGYIVLVTGLRGSSGDGGASTFGLLEADDVRAAVEMLARRVDVDPARIAVLGIGTGANAAMLAAEGGPQIKALVLDRPVTDPGNVVADHLSLPQPWLQWMRPGFKWAFELTYGVRSDDLDPRRHEKMLQARPVLIFDARTSSDSLFRTNGLERTRHFLATHLAETTNVARTEP